MPDLTGLEFSRLLPAKSKVVFTTAFDQYAIEGYKVNALDYLLKPFDYNEFLNAAQKARNHFEINCVQNAENQQNKKIQISFL